MKKAILSALLILTFFSVVNASGTIGNNCIINSIQKADSTGLTYVTFSCGAGWQFTNVCVSPNPNNSNYFFVISPSQSQEKYLNAYILTAFTANKTVTVYGNGICSQGYEQIDAVVVQQ